MVIGWPLSSATKEGRRGRAGGGARLVLGDGEARRAVLLALGRDHDEGAVIFLILALDEGVAGDRAGGAVREVDHVIGLAALAVVEAGIGDLDPRAPALHIMAASAALEAAAGDHQGAGAAIVDGVGAAGIFRAAAKLG